MNNTSEDYWINYGFYPTGESGAKVWLLDGQYNDNHAMLDVFNAPNRTVNIPDLGSGGYNARNSTNFLIVPPRTSVTIFDKVQYSLDGKGSKTFETPGLYQLKNYNLENDVASMKAAASVPWSDMMVPCCAGKIDGKWCGSWNPTKSGSTCDARMKEWCSLAANKDRDECACINSSIKYLPSCFDTKCTNNPIAYKTKDMKDVVNAGCPDIMECNQYISLTDEAKQNVVNRTQMEQNCTSIKNETPTGSTTNTNPTPTADSNTGDQPDSGSYGTVDNGLGSTSPYVPTEPTQPYTPPSSSPYAGTTQPGAYSNPYQPTTTTSYPYSGSSTSTASSSDSAKIMGLEPATLMIILVVVFAFIIIIIMVSSSGSSNQYSQYPQYSQYQQYPGRY